MGREEPKKMRDRERREWRRMATKISPLQIEHGDSGVHVRRFPHLERGRPSDSHLRVFGTR